MKKHEEYNLEFKIGRMAGYRDEPVCNVTYNDNLPHWENYLILVLEESLYGVALELISIMQEISNGEWIGDIMEQDNVVLFEKSLTEVRFDLEDGFAYFDEGTFTDPLMVVKISFVDLTQILEEWQEFLESFMDGYYATSFFQ